MDKGCLSDRKPYCTDYFHVQELLLVERFPLHASALFNEHNGPGLVTKGFRLLHRQLSSLSLALAFCATGAREERRLASRGPALTGGSTQKWGPPGPLEGTADTCIRAKRQRHPAGDDEGGAAAADDAERARGGRVVMVRECTPSSNPTHK